MPAPHTNRVEELLQAGGEVHGVQDGEQVRVLGEAGQPQLWGRSLPPPANIGSAQTLHWPGEADNSPIEGIEIGVEQGRRCDTQAQQDRTRQVQRRVETCGARVKLDKSHSGLSILLCLLLNQNRRVNNIYISQTCKVHMSFKSENFSPTLDSE